ncbi:deaminase, partial [Methanothrix sp.]
SGTHHELCRAVHAEQNAIIQAAMHGISIEGATLYCTHQPCILCAKMMINAGVRKVVYQHRYPDQTALEFLEQAGIEVVRVEEDFE